MHAKSTVAVALLAAAPIVNAGSAVVKNQCGFTTYLWSVAETAGTMHTLSPGEEYSESYQTNPNGGGISLKIATQPDSYGTVAQFEYTVDSTLWYDLSMINGNPFQQWGMTLQSSSSACRNVLCPAGVAECAQAYNAPDQNWATASCTPDANLILELCSGQDNTNTPVHKINHAVGSALNAAVAEPQHNKHHNKHHDKHHEHKNEHHNKHHNDSHEHKKHHNKHHDKHHNKHHDKAPVPAPAPAPVSVPAPAVSVPAVAAAATTFVTQLVTVTARDAKPSAHAHANYHRHHFHHHS